jgi:hypothetical protein
VSRALNRGIRERGPFFLTNAIEPLAGRLHYAPLGQKILSRLCERLPVNTRGSVTKRALPDSCVLKSGGHDITDQTRNSTSRTYRRSDVSRANFGGLHYQEPIRARTALHQNRKAVGMEACATMCAAEIQSTLCRVRVRTDKTHGGHNESALPPESEHWNGSNKIRRSARLSPKVLAISAHTIFKLEQTAGAALNYALLRQIVDNLRRHPKTARQSVG